MTISVVHVASYLLFISSSRGYKLLAYNINYVQAYGVPSWKNGFYFGFRQRIICGQWEKSNLNERTFKESLMKMCYVSLGIVHQGVCIYKHSSL